MTRGTGHTSNKFLKMIGSRSFIVEVGNAPHQYTLDQLKAGEATGDFTAEEIAEIIAIYEPPKEKADAPAPDAKRGPGRPRKVSPKVDPAAEVQG